MTINFTIGVRFVKYHLTKQLTLAGLTAALAVVIMNLIGLLGIATYVCPVLCMMLLCVLVKLCSRKICWCWYIVVSILSFLFAPDKEAVAVFLFLGYYPILRPWINQCKFPFVLKILLFNVSITVMYSVLLYLFGISELVDEMQGIGVAGTVILFALGNLTFFLLDFVLYKFDRRR